MTVTYTAQVATCRGFGCFLKLLFRWRGSIYKLVWLDLVCFLLIYYTLNITYRIGLSPSQKLIFESIAKYCAAYSNLIPLSFVLGFYVSVVMTRWWNQYINIPWPDSIAVFVSSTIHGQDERGRVMRRTIMRYVCLCLTMVLRNIAPRVKKRFPTLSHLVEAGLLLESERLIMEALNEKFPPYSKHWLPIVWAASIVTRARKEGRIRDDFAVKTVIDELNKFRGQCGILTSYDTISIPLVYTQVVTLAVYSFFLTSVMGQQWTENKTIEEGYFNIIDLYFPIFTTLQFFFYMGWLKVAESLINPFGEDDDDFEVNWIVDRNLQVAYIIVDEMHHDHPELLKDQYWDEVLPVELPYTIASQNIKDAIPLPSTANVDVKKGQGETIHAVPSSVKVHDMVGKSNQSVNLTAKETANQSVNYKFPEPENELADDGDNGIHFSATRNRPTSIGSSSSTHSFADTITRVNTVASALKKFFNRDDTSRQNSVTTSVHTPGMQYSASTASLQKPSHQAMGSMRITEPIEEVDEQLTITSMKPPEPRPNVQNIFSVVPQLSGAGSSTSTTTAPIDIPKRSADPYMRTQSQISHNIGGFMPSSQDIFSTSAPTDMDISLTQFQPELPPLAQPDATDIQKSMESLASKKKSDATGQDQDMSMEPEDEFEKLRQVREQEKLERQKQKLTRSVSIHPQVADSQTPLPPLTPAAAVEQEDLLIDQLIDAANEEFTAQSSKEDTKAEKTKKPE